MPLLSIVIANYNYGRFLEEAIRSVLSQIGEGKKQVHPGEVELIIIDGGSTDNSVDVIKKYANGLPPDQLRSKLYPLSTPLSYWISEPDKGQSNAFNKGFAQATGKFLTWLNADDVILPGTIEMLRRLANDHSSCEWFVGGSMWLDPCLKVIKCVRARMFSTMRYKCGMVSAWGPSCFFSKQLLELVGGVDERLHYMMDTDLWMKFARAGYRYEVLPCYAYGLRLHPDAKMSGHNFVGSSQANPEHPRWKQIAFESSIVHRLIKESRYTLLKRLLSMGWASYFCSQLDTIIKKGKAACEV